MTLSVTRVRGNGRAVERDCGEEGITIAMRVKRRHAELDGAVIEEEGLRKQRKLNDCASHIRSAPVVAEATAMSASQSQHITSLDSPAGDVPEVSPASPTRKPSRRSNQARVKRLLTPLGDARRKLKNAKQRYRYAVKRVKLGYWPIKRLLRAQRECDEEKASVSRVLLGTRTFRSMEKPIFPTSFINHKSEEHPDRRSTRSSTGVGERYIYHHEARVTTCNLDGAGSVDGQWLSLGVVVLVGALVSGFMAVGGHSRPH